MAKYKKERIAQLFDNLAAAGKDTKRKTLTSDHSIPQITSEKAFRRLELGSKDVLFDVGTGTGEKAIRAARICRQVIGIDISKKSLEIACKKAMREKLDNLVFTYSSFEEPCAELDLTQCGITKILAVYSLHHLSDQLKKESLGTLVQLLHRPGRMVIGDLMFFDEPNKYRHQFYEIGYDGGDTDFPSGVEYLTECLANLEARLTVEKIHPLVGVIVADWT